jgi:hypothetical protein
MWPYYFFLFTLFSMAYRVRNSPRSSHALFATMVPILLVFVAFRYEVGCDWGGYELHFMLQNSAALGEFIPNIDPLYWLLIDLINYVGLPYEALNITTAALFFFGFWVFARQFQNPMAILAFSFPVLIFAIPMSATRQALATGVLLLAFAALMRSKYIRGSFLIVLAAQFHSSAIVFLTFIPIIFLGGTIKGWLLGAPFFAIGALVGLQSESFEIASMRYIEGSNDAAGAIFRTALLGAFGLYYKLALSRQWAAILPSSYPIVNVGSIFLIGAFPLGFLWPTIADRYGYYLHIFAAVIAACIPYLAKKPRNLPYMAAMIGICIFFIGWSLLSWQVNLCYVPYQSWIFGLPSGVNFQY